MVTAGWCQCPCHDVAEGDLQSDAQQQGEHLRRARINGLGAVAVKVDLEVDAFFACPTCQRYHCSALSGRPPELDVARRLVYRPIPTEYRDAPRAQQADGDDGN